MKKKIRICIAGVVLLAILFVPIPSGTCAPENSHAAGGQEGR